ncbi:hypothetical protein [Fluviicola chungangensis]|uniref:Uncharacterized protein n=1 Tax=Fluviicola chungangensis TaxID=2597671 RepID=A0A556N0X8_9FLAO|nr:hypothetical protein [Fluviicola chungangensis]TSJ45852.1 hypothetical protein FO442_08890 [Fluviicola chungangensis]
MKKTIFLALILVSGVALGQDYRSGDVELDASLKIVNNDANKDLTFFKANLAKTFNVGLPKVETCFKVGMNAGDVFMAFQISNIAKRPIEDVISVYKTSKSKGWGAMAKELGIKPGSAEFHALKGKAKDKSKGNSGAKSNGNGNGKSNGNSGKSKGNGNGKGKK